MYEHQIVSTNRSEIITHNIGEYQNDVTSCHSIAPQPSTSKHADELESSPSSSEEAGHIRKNKKS
ncbi:unnamed protein product [Acanthoscelides obtectus]|uniref:Uncharacterized protein n=1 Tax=Acanthoscelides obtectus TaxID=200917 RepID=A0A9P0K6M9_ACAOB|nr:unnamed protein product [Acanthoscelides obtectus]CAK1633257.1 hypothetical protein AOBTE_LOCUS8006 [Acanthoscelides obtectus]